MQKRKVVDKKTMEQIKEACRDVISEWSGNDMPEEDDEDFDTLDEDRAWVDGMETIEEAVDFLEGKGIDVPEFFESLEIEYPQDSGKSAR